MFLVKEDTRHVCYAPLFQGVSAVSYNFISALAQKHKTYDSNLKYLNMPQFLTQSLTLTLLCRTLKSDMEVALRR